MSETQRYFGDWKNWQDMIDGFGETEGVLPASFPTDAEVVVAGYETEPYSGSATVVFQRDGRLFETSSSHCSCNGLEWSAGTEISWEYVEKRLADGHFWGLNGDGIELLKAQAVDQLSADAVLRDFHGITT
jgi:hypothetical protein